MNKKLFLDSEIEIVKFHDDILTLSGEGCTGDTCLGNCGEDEDGGSDPVVFEQFEISVFD